jgi:uncharacterized protein with PIN domain
MAIPCPDCGRQYDVTQFAFGRTVDCSCGARVTLEMRHTEPARPPRFLADEMLGRLARWLRALGFDTLHETGQPDAVLVRTAFREHRILLTRDRRLCLDWSFDGCVVLESGRPAGQLIEVDRRFDIGRDWRSRLFTRCMICNTVLHPVAGTAVPLRSARGPDLVDVPARGAGPGTVHSYCPGCGRIYWEGRHTRRMRAWLERTLGSR